MAQRQETDLLLHNAVVVLERSTIHGGVLARDGRIAAVFAEADKPSGLPDAETMDLAGAHLAPGMIDIHIHGAAGVDVQDTDEVGLKKLSEFLLSRGVTS